MRLAHLGMFIPKYESPTKNDTVMGKSVVTTKDFGDNESVKIQFLID